MNSDAQALVAQARSAVDALDTVLKGALLVGPMKLRLDQIRKARFALDICRGFVDDADVVVEPVVGREG